MTIAWFSAGASSAVAIKLAIEQIDHILYTHIDDHHPDSLRFVSDCEKWFDKQIKILQSPYKTVCDAIMSTAAHPSGVYVNGPRGAPCTRILKRHVRKKWEYEQQGDDLIYLWGFDCTEKDRADRVLAAMPSQRHIFPLIERNIDKEEAHRILRASHIKRPYMYELGYHNNNCVGCVKGGMGYWNKIRKDFPEVFHARAKMERIAGATCINGVFLDELDPLAGRHEKPITGDCGILCEIMSI